MFKLLSLLQRIEAHEKTGLLIIKQGSGTWVELYFRDGRLMCIGPLRTNATLADRLLYDGVISSQAYQDVLRIIGPAEKSEIPFAITLMDNGHATQEQLRAWAAKKATEVLQVLLSWNVGEVHFEEQVSPHAERLLVALSVSTLLATIPEPSTVAQAARSSSATSWLLDQPQTPRLVSATPVPKTYVARIPTLTHPSQFFADVTPSSGMPVADVAPGPNVARNFSQVAPNSDRLPPMAPQRAQTPFSQPRAVPVQSIDKLPTVPTPQDDPDFTPRAVPVQGIDLLPTVPTPQGDSGFMHVQREQDSASLNKISAASLLSDVSLPFSPQPEPVQASSPTPVVAPTYVDISYMRPEMVLMPAEPVSNDASAPVRITPDQWRLLTKVDGQASLQVVCQELNMQPELVCRLAGELIAQKALTLAMPSMQQVEEAPSVAREMMASGLGNGYVAPGYAAATTPPLSAPAAPLAAPMPPGSLPFETESQWGNGGNGASFVPGHGWVTTPHPAQPMSGNSSVLYAQNYVGVGGR